MSINQEQFEIQDELSHVFAYHTNHNYEPPDIQEEFGTVDLSSEIQAFITDSLGEVSVPVKAKLKVFHVVLANISSHKASSSETQPTARGWIVAFDRLFRLVRTNLRTAYRFKSI